MIPPRVKSILLANDLEALEFQEGSTPTSEMAAAQIGCQVGQIAKSILVKAKDGNFYLVVCAGDLRIDNKKLKATIGFKARMATGEETEQVTGFKPGGVCPFGIDGLQIFIDTSLKQYQTIYPAAGNNASGVPITFAKLQAITQATEVDVMKTV